MPKFPRGGPLSPPPSIQIVLKPRMDWLYVISTYPKSPTEGWLLLRRGSTNSTPIADTSKSWGIQTTFRWKFFAFKIFSFSMNFFCEMLQITAKVKFHHTFLALKLFHLCMDFLRLILKPLFRPNFYYILRIYNLQIPGGLSAYVFSICRSCWIS